MTASHDRSSVLLVSIDGLAPRHVTTATAPRLTTLARSGASCFQARTVEPTVTLPAHFSLARGVAPATHGVLDNDPPSASSPASTPTPDAGSMPPSILAAARAAGLRTAAFQSWLPFEHLWEPGARSTSFSIDDGYNPAADDVVLDAAVRHLTRSRSEGVAGPEDAEAEVVFVYLSLPDLVGHDHGWDSAEYLAAVRATDRRIGALVDAAPDGWSIVITTDHGGHERTHGTDRIEDLETFVVANGPVVEPGTVWPTASILDVAPTVAELAGFPAESGWEGRSLLGTGRPFVDVVFDQLASMADHTYGERVDMLSHTLQTAAVAADRGASDELILAALLHDIGHIVPTPTEVQGNEPGEWGLPDHAEVGARHLQAQLPPAVVEPIRLHVEAKRFRVAVDPDYHQHLSLASRMSLAEQGGPLDEAEVDAYRAEPFGDDAVRLRAFDDDGKVDGLPVPPLEHYRPLLVALATPRSSQPTPRPGPAKSDDPAFVDPTWARHACRCPECRDPGNDQHLLTVEELAGWTVVAHRESSGDVDLVHTDGRRHTSRIPTSPPTPAEPVRRSWGVEHGARLRAAAVDAATPWAAGIGDGVDDDRSGRFARQLTVDGIALAVGVPTVEGEVLAVAERLGHVRETNYGRLFDVVAEPDPVNLAYTPVGLPLHTDNPYREPCPTVQLLHCLTAADAGGASLFADGFRAAELLRAEAPEAFDTLTTTPIDFRFHTAPGNEGDGRPAVDLRARRPIIEVDLDGTVVAVSVNNRSMEAPTLTPRESAAFYAAYLRFNRILNAPDSTFSLTLGPGELVAFDNRRVLHGRTAFTVTRRRHLQGCYIDMDAGGLARPRPPRLG